MIDAAKEAVVIICTRPDSRRLPGKAFRVIAGLPAIEHILSRLNVKKGAGQVGQPPVVLAVPVGCSDYDYLLDHYDVHLCQGNPTSPLDRMADALDWFEDEHGDRSLVVRITHDDLLIDFTEMMSLLELMFQHGGGYGCTPTILEGAGVEVFTTKNLRMAALKQFGQNIEHISYYVKGEGCPNPDIVKLEVRPEIKRSYRLTLDYEEDATVLETILRRIGPLASNDVICKFLDQNAFLLRHNALPKFSVYTCAYNAGRWVRDALRSVPPAGDVEQVIVDDCSTDDTLLEILRDRVWRDNGKIIVNEKNVGLATSSNTALSRCRGRYVLRLDADDILKPWALERMLLHMKAEDAAVVYANFDEIDEDGRVVRENVNARDSHHAGCALMDAKLINQLRFRDGLRHWDSLELFKRVKENFPIAYVDEPLWFYRRHRDSVSAELTPERAAAHQDLFGKPAELVGA